MHKTTSINKQFLLLGIPLLMIFALVFLANSKVFHNNSDVVSLTITLDLLFFIPLVYFVIIRKTTIPKSSIFLVVIVGVAIASHILSKENQYFLNVLKTWGLPAAEIAIVVLVLRAFKKTLKKHKLQDKLYPDFYTSLKKICNDILPSVIVAPIASEIALLYYGLID